MILIRDEDYRITQNLRRQTKTFSKGERGELSTGPTGCQESSLVQLDTHHHHSLGSCNVLESLWNYMSTNEVLLLPAAFLI